MRQDQDRVHDSRRFRLERVFAGRRHRAALVELTRGLAAAERDVPTTVEQVRPRFVEPRVGSDTWRQWEEVALEVGHIGRLYLRIPCMAVYPSLATCRKQTAIIRKQDCYSNSIYWVVRKKIHTTMNTIAHIHANTQTHTYKQIRLTSRLQFQTHMLYLMHAHPALSFSRHNPHDMSGAYSPSNVII